MAIGSGLRTLVEREGPFASCYVPLDAETRLNSEALGIEAKNVRRALTSADVPAELADKVEEAMRQPVPADPPGGGTRVVITAGDEVVVDDWLPIMVPQAMVHVDPLPRITPMIEATQLAVPHVIVLADRVGAELTAVGPEDDTVTETVEGSTLHIHRGHPGGWSQRRFQQRAENRWESNAAEVAEEVGRLCDQVGARLVAVAGDERAAGFLTEHLPTRYQPMVVPLEGSRHDSDPDQIGAEVARQIATIAASDTVELLHRWRSAEGAGNGTSGPEDTVVALRQALAAELLVHDDPEDDRIAYYAPDGLFLSLREDDRPGEDALPTARLIDAAVRSALLGGAEVRVVPRGGGPDGSLGAIRR